MLQFEDYGSGPILGLIHGSPGSSESWKAVGERLKDRFRIIAPTLPGHGGLPSGAVAPVETEDLAAEVEEVFASLPGPVLLAGHSFGGNVALRVAMRGKVDISHLTLLEPVETPALRVAGDDQAFFAVKAVFDDYIKQFESGEENAVATMVDYWFGHAAFRRMPAKVQNFLRVNTAVNVRDVQAGFRQRLSAADLNSLSMPITVVYGTRSPDVTLKIARALASHVGVGRIAALQDADHAMLVSHVSEVADLISRESLN